MSLQMNFKQLNQVFDECVIQVGEVKSLPFDVQKMVFFYLDESLCVECGKYMLKYEVPIHKLCPNCVKDKTMKMMTKYKVAEQHSSIIEQLKLLLKISSTDKAFIEYFKKQNTKLLSWEEETLEKIEILRNEIVDAWQKLAPYNDEYEKMTTVLTSKITSEKFLARRVPDLFAEATEIKNKIQNKIDELDKYVQHLRSLVTYYIPYGGRSNQEQYRHHSRKCNYKGKTYNYRVKCICLVCAMRMHDKAEVLLVIAEQNGKYYQ